MNEGLLWYDDSARDLADKVGQAARRYRYKFGAAPDVCYVHPSTLEGSGEGRKVSGVRVATLPSVLQHHFWLGQEEEQHGQGRRKPKPA